MILDASRAVTDIYVVLSDRNAYSLPKIIADPDTVPIQAVA